MFISGNRTLRLILVSLCLVITHSATALQTQTFNVSSWKRGTSTVQEIAFEIDLRSLRGGHVTKVIKDSSGLDRYELTLGCMEHSDGSLVDHEWFVNLTELGATQPVNLLKPSNDPHQDSFGPEDGIYRLIYDPYYGKKDRLTLEVPFLSKRIIQVEGFSCIVRVHEVVFSKNRRGVKSAKVSFAFKNSKLRE